MDAVTSVRAWRLVVTTCALLLVACQVSPSADTSTVYVDGSRGCKQQAGPVAIWDQAGAAAVGGHVVAELPHGVEMEVLEEATQYGITFYRVEHEAVQGWLPINFTETIPPICE